jgi:hypothetical protein
VIAVLSALATGCGSSPPAARPPQLPRTLARDLAARSDAVAASLANGDRCGAAVRAAALRQAAQGAVRQGRVVRRLASRLLPAVDSLAVSLPACPPPATSEPKPPRAHDHGKHKGKHKHEGGD